MWTASIWEQDRPNQLVIWFNLRCLFPQKGKTDAAIKQRIRSIIYLLLANNPGGHLYILTIPPSPKIFRDAERWTTLMKVNHFIRKQNNGTAFFFYWFRVSAYSTLAYHYRTHGINFHLLLNMAHENPNTFHLQLPTCPSSTCFRRSAKQRGPMRNFFKIKFPPTPKFTIIDV
jgi:hypothetical protein